MGYAQVIENIIAQKLLDLHTAYLGKVLSVKGNTATVQPLGKIKGTDGTTKNQAVVSNIPIAATKIGKKTINYVDGVTLNKSKSDGYVDDVSLSVSKASVTVAVEESIGAGDIVVCVVCDRNITDAKRGINGVPAIGHHSLSDSVIIGVL